MMRVYAIGSTSPPARWHPYLRVERVIPAAPRLCSVLLMLLREHGPLCEECLGHHAQIPLSQVGVHLVVLREIVAVRVETRKCPGCARSGSLDSRGISRLTQVFSLDLDR